MTISKKVKVAVGVSGGVDSSVCALLLKDQGYDVTGVHMQCWDYKLPGCRGEKDRSDAIKICSKLNIPFKDLNFEKEYREKVLTYFFSEIKNGRTPNPDVWCNREIKFGLFLNWAIDNGFDYVATGHYARIAHSTGEFELVSAIDDSKDQSYFLYRLVSKDLEKVLFPLGELKKSQVRELARTSDLVTFDKPDSTGICFIGDINVADFIKAHLPLKKGKVVDMSGEVVGEHAGIELYTIGQRHGFTLTKYFGLPMYVVKKDAEKNQLVVGFGKDALVKSFEISNLSFVNQKNMEKVLGSGDGGLECKIRIRNLGEKMPGKVFVESVEKLRVGLFESISGVSPGQSAVLYIGVEKLGDLVLGGGVIV